MHAQNSQPLLPVLRGAEQKRDVRLGGDHGHLVDFPREFKERQNPTSLLLRQPNSSEDELRQDLKAPISPSNLHAQNSQPLLPVLRGAEQKRDVRLGGDHGHLVEFPREFKERQIPLHLPLTGVEEQLQLPFPSMRTFQ